MSEVLDRIKARWAAENVVIRPGNSPGTLAAFELKYGVVLPPAVRDYFAAADGTGDDSDCALFRFWPLAEVMPMAEYDGYEQDKWPGSANWFYFADFMICSHSFAVRLTSDSDEGGPVAIVDGSLYPLAASFEAFLNRYLTDRDSLRYFPPAKEESSLGRDDPDVNLLS